MGRKQCGLLVFVLLAGACGGESEEGWTVNEEDSTGDERVERPEEQMQITGLMGTLTQDDVDRGLQPRLPRFMRCFTRRYQSIEMLAGRIDMAFRVAVDGSVARVYARQSTVGDRATERCVLEVAGSTRFREPRGNGEAEFNWPLEFDPPEDVRPPVQWDSMHVSATLAENVTEVLSTCPINGSAVEVTAYVAPGGRVLAAGAVAGQETDEATLDCVSDAVTQWEMPDPGSYPAKVSFVVR